MRSPSPIFVSVALTLAVAPAFAQTQPDASAPQFGERLEVRLVQVDAWASAAGRPVLDLKQSELKLSEDGKPVEILYFAPPIVDLESPPVAESAPGAEPPEGGRAAPQATEPMVVAIFLDEAHLGPGGRARTIAALRDWVAGGGLPRGADTLLVAHERELKVLLGRTRDPARLLAALDRLDGPSTVAVDLKTAERSAIEQIRDQQRWSIEAQVGGKFGGAGVADEAAAAAADAGDDVTIYGEPPCSGRLLQYAEEYADRVTIEARASLDSLSAFADSLAALRGRKLLVFVSEGMPSRPGGAAFDYVRTLCDGSGMREGIQYAVDVQAQASGSALRGQLNGSALALAGEDRSLTRTIDQVVARANSSGVSVWTFGAAGMSASGSDASQEMRTATPATQSRQQGEAQDVLNALAVDTGGRAIVESNDFGAAFAALADDLFQGYSIAFASPRAGDGKRHTLRLETTRPGVQLRYRRSWRDTSTEEELAGLMRGALDFGIDRPALGAVATIGRQQGEGGAQRLILRLTLPRSAVTSVPDAKGGREGKLKLAIALRPAGGEATPIRTRTIAVETAAGGANAGEPIVQDVTLPEIGRGALVAVGLRDELSGEVGIFRLEVGGS